MHRGGICRKALFLKLLTIASEHSCCCYKLQHHEVIITGRPIGKKGSLLIKGCFIRAFNLLCLHPINNQTIGIPIKEQKYFQSNPSLQSGGKGKQNSGNTNLASNKVFKLVKLLG